MDLNASCQLIDKIVALKYKSIDLIFASIAKERGKQTGPSKDRARAIHIECSRTHKRKISLTLKKFYSTTNQTEYPDGVLMRLVPEIKDLHTRESK